MTFFNKQEIKKKIEGKYRLFLFDKFSVNVYKHEKYKKYGSKCCWPRIT